MIKGNKYWYVNGSLHREDDAAIIYSNGRKEYYAVFGQYILTPEIFTVLNKNIKNKKVENGEYQLTSAIDEVSEKNGAYAYIVDGTMYDVGNVQSYMCTMQENR